MSEKISQSNTNPEVSGANIDVPFEDLPDGEKAKDLSRVKIAVALFE